MLLEINELIKQLCQHEKSYTEYQNINKKIAQIRRNCNHKNSYYVSQDKDEHEGRVYDINVCDDCGDIHETRSYAGLQHDYPSKEEFFQPKNNSI